MSNPKVMICYSPRLYAELFISVLKTLCGIEIIDADHDSFVEGIPKSSRPDADIIILSLDDDGRPTMEKLPAYTPKSKVLAFSPTGKIGLRRLPNSNAWEEISPFGLDQLIREVVVSSSMPHLHSQ